MNPVIGIAIKKMNDKVYNITQRQVEFILLLHTNGKVKEETPFST